VELRSLGGDVPPPSPLKTRVLHDLRARGVLRPAGAAAPAPRWWPLAAAAAAVAVFVAGYALGGRPPGPVPQGPARYALLLYDDAASAAIQPDPRTVAEYVGWARSWRERGLFVDGEKLGPGGELLVARGADVLVEPLDVGTAAELWLTGFFLIGAESDSAAVAVARSCPHLRHGGRIVLRRLDTP
jgi:hypothetical protein